MGSNPPETTLCSTKKKPKVKSVPSLPLRRPWIVGELDNGALYISLSWKGIVIVKSGNEGYRKHLERFEQVQMGLWNEKLKYKSGKFLLFRLRIF